MPSIGPPLLWAPSLSESDCVKAFQCLLFRCGPRRSVTHFHTNSCAIGLLALTKHLKAIWKWDIDGKILTDKWPYC